MLLLLHYFILFLYITYYLSTDYVCIKSVRCNFRDVHRHHVCNYAFTKNILNTQSARKLLIRIRILYTHSCNCPLVFNIKPKAKEKFTKLSICTFYNTQENPINKVSHFSTTE
jgi:hypothetical protein